MTPEQHRGKVRPKPGCQATYAVLVGGKTVGYVDKYVHEEVTRAGGQRSGRSTRTAKFTSWGQRQPGVLEAPPGHRLRKEAVDRLLGSLAEGWPE